MKAALHENKIFRATIVKRNSHPSTGEGPTRVQNYCENEKLYRRIKWKKNHPLENSLNRKSLFCYFRNVFGAFYPADQRPFAGVPAFHGNFKLCHRDCNLFNINGLSEKHIPAITKLFFHWKVGEQSKKKSQQSWSFIFVAQIK